MKSYFDKRGDKRSIKDIEKLFNQTSKDLQNEELIKSAQVPLIIQDHLIDFQIVFPEDSIACSSSRDSEKTLEKKEENVCNNHLVSMKTVAHKHGKNRYRKHALSALER